jgi:hypothetical protein
LATKLKRRSRSPLEKRARRGFRGYPVATVAFYGPDDQRASKVAVGIVREQDGQADPLQRWFAEESDVRRDPAIGAEILAFVREHGAQSVVMTDRIIGCPHEEGTDYPEGQACPRCRFWAHRDRWSGEVIH